MNPHHMLPETNLDEQAMQDFVADFRKYLASALMPGNEIVYEHRVRPKFRSAHDRDPATHREVRQWMTKDDYYQFWSATQRRSQELMWESVIAPTERQLDALVERYRDAARARPAGGTLELDEALEVPRYHTAVDIHIQPGGYHTDFADDDVAAGALYEGGLPIYIGGALGPNSDGIGRALAEYVQKGYADVSPRRVLDMGCAVGNSTLPWAVAYPDAEIHAIDVAAPCLRFAHARSEAYGLPIHYSQQNAEETRFADGSFDLVISHIMLHETSKKALTRILEESLRLLKPGGLMFHLDVPRGSSPFEQFMMQWECYNNNETFGAYLTDANLVDVATAAGFPEPDVAMEEVPGGMYDGQKNYSTADFVWPVLVGRKR
ncbi:MAG: class I SAM-dependent methyltransferase [Pseudomonadota bacterium]